MPDKEFIEERVVCTVNPEREDHFIPRIKIAKSSGGLVEKSVRPIESNDISRILDFEGVTEAPPDGPIMHGEEDNQGNLSFPRRHFCIRGGFMFYFDESDVTVSGQYNVEYHGVPLGVIPLDNVQVTLPPGGRRVFREHAQTNARTGYELAILHKGAAGRGDGARPPAFIVAQNLQIRDKWVNAIKERAKFDGQTKLRAVLAYQADPSIFTSRPQDLLKRSRQNQGIEKGRDRRTLRKGKRAGTKQIVEEEPGSNEALVKEALQEFGQKKFSENMFLDQFFEQYTELDAQTEIPKMEKWQNALKKGLKGAVLEQYEYFVVASTEFSKMGREVLDLKNMVETQVETIRDMKEIDFSMIDDDEYSDDSDSEENGMNGKSKRKSMDDDSDAASEISDSKDKFDIVGQSGLNFRDPDSKEGIITIPAFLDDSAEEILAFVKESRYTDATDLWAKARLEVIGLLHLHETPTLNFLTRKQYAKIQSLIETLDDLAEKISNRLVENLRRKNEALKQASKRERTDPSAHLVPSVSPCCLNDDLVPLRLLVKLGKSQEAATAYSSRRSLLLQESLNERPLAGTGSVDLEIYAAQLSQSFFSCLAISIEGFLDLFLVNPPPENKQYGLDEGSINTDTGSLKDLPAGALSSIVLWCDSELSKFSNSFGGARILGMLPLSPPPRESAKKGPRVLGKSNGSKERQMAIETAAKCVSQAFQYASENLDTVGLPLTPRLAESLRKRLKGCEAEVAQAMDDEWKAIVLEWEYPLDGDVDERR